MVRRVITKFLHGQDHREGEIDVTHVPLDEMSRIVQPGPADPLMYDSYRLNQNQLKAPQPHVSEIIDLTRYDYDLEAEAE